MNTEKELRRGRMSDIVSFDIFDTLIERDVPRPADVFLHAAKKVLKDGAEAKTFQRNRIEAEAEARRKSGNGEVGLEEIYKELYACYGDKTERLKAAEVEFEVTHCRPREKWSGLFRSFVESGMKVVLISDMYLSSEVISRMLHRCGVKGYKGLYVSNEHGCDKVGGKLFGVARRKEGCEGCRHLHYGDSLRADYLGAKKGGATPRLVLKRGWMDKMLRKLLCS